MQLHLEFFWLKHFSSVRRFAFTHIQKEIMLRKFGAIKSILCDSVGEFYVRCFLTEFIKSETGATKLSHQQFCFYITLTMQENHIATDESITLKIERQTIQMDTE